MITLILRPALRNTLKALFKHIILSDVGFVILQLGLAIRRIFGSDSDKIYNPDSDSGSENWADYRFRIGIANPNYNSTKFKYKVILLKLP